MIWLISQKHTILPSQEVYGVIIVSFLEKIECGIMALWYIMQEQTGLQWQHIVDPNPIQHYN